MYLQIMEIFCRLGEYFVDDGNILQIMGIICRLWKYFADYGNTLQILGHRGGATLLGFDAMWMSCSALVLFIIIIIVILISIIVDKPARLSFSCSLDLLLNERRE